MEQQGNNTLAGKQVIIFGGSSGIGLATAVAAAEEGALVTIVSGNQQRIDSAVQQIGKECKGYAADLSKEEHIKNFFAQAGHFDHMVYTAGESLQLGNIGDVALETARQFFNVRYWGAFAAVKYGAPHINDGGSISLTSGLASMRPGAGWSLGASICSAMEGFSRAMAVELAPLRVNVVCPGLVKTNLWNSFTEEARENLFTSIGNGLPVKRIGEAADIAQAYIYLMKQGFGTGQTIVVDGGASRV